MAPSRIELMHQVKHAYLNRMTVGNEAALLVELVSIACTLMDIRALEEWCNALGGNPQAPVPESATTKARRTA